MLPDAVGCAFGAFGAGASSRQATAVLLSDPLELIGELTSSQSALAELVNRVDRLAQRFVSPESARDHHGKRNPVPPATQRIALPTGPLSTDNGEVHEMGAVGRAPTARRADSS